MGALLDAEKWKELAPVAQTKVELECMKCSHRFEMTLNAVMNMPNHGGCFCLKKTQGMVFSFLRDSFDQVFWEFRLSKHKNFPYDICLVVDEHTILIEVDGSHHFGIRQHRRSTQQHCDETEANDAQKEHNALAYGASVIRLRQESVWNNQFKWKEWLKNAILYLKTVPPCVVSHSHVDFERRICAWSVVWRASEVVT